VAVLGKNIWGPLPLIIWEATTAKRNYYRTNQKFGGLGKIWGPVPPDPNIELPLDVQAKLTCMGGWLIPKQ